MTNCEEFRPSIDALVDGTLSGAARTDLEAHLAGCRDCTALVEDLLVVRRAARSLPALEPPERVWSGIAGTVSRASAPASGQGAWRRRLAVPLAAAAVLLAAVAITLIVRRDRAVVGAPATPVAPAGQAQASQADYGSIEDELQQAESHYQKAIDKLEALARDRQSLDPGVAADLQKNLLIIDRAIGESRAALRTQPTSERAQESLFEAFRSKIALLQDTITLINEMRKGNQAETARVAEGLDKS